MQQKNAPTIVSAFVFAILQNDVYKSAGDNDNLLWCCTIQKFRNLFVSQNNLLNLSRCKGCINCDACLWFAVELNKQFHFACLCCAFVTNGEFFHNDGCCVASLVPQFLGDVWRKWCQSFLTTITSSHITLEDGIRNLGILFSMSVVIPSSSICMTRR